MKESDNSWSEVESLDWILDHTEDSKIQLESLLSSVSDGTPNSELARMLAQRLIEDVNATNIEARSRLGLINNLTSNSEHAAISHLYRIRDLPGKYEQYCRMSPARTPGAQTLACRLYRIYIIQAVLLLGFPGHKRAGEIKHMLPQRLKVHPFVQRIEETLQVK